MSYTAQTPQKFTYCLRICFISYMIKNFSHDSHDWYDCISFAYILYYYYYYYHHHHHHLLQLSFHSVAVVLTLETKKNKYT